MASSVQTKLPLGQVLLNRGLVTQDQIDTALDKQKSQGHNRLLGELMVELGFCSENQIAARRWPRHTVFLMPRLLRVCAIRML